MKPIKGYDVVHHAVASIVTDEVPADGAGTLVEYSMGKNGDIYPEGTGRLLPAGANVSWNLHLHATGKRSRRRSRSRSSSIPRAMCRSIGSGRN